MSSESKADLQLEIAHVLLLDIVGYSKLLVDEQRDVVHKLNQIVRSTGEFQRGEAAGKLICLATGDGMALVFFANPDAPVKSALEIAAVLKSYPHIQVRMGIHSGQISGVSDVNER